METALNKKKTGAIVAAYLNLLMMWVQKSMSINNNVQTIQHTLQYL